MRRPIPSTIPKVQQISSLSEKRGNERLINGIILGPTNCQEHVLFLLRFLSCSLSESVYEFQEAEYGHQILPYAQTSHVNKNRSHVSTVESNSPLPAECLTLALASQ